MKNVLLFIVAIIIAGGSGFALQKYLNQPQIQTENNPAIGLQRPEFSAIDLDGNMRNIKEWDGKVLLINFWATWCPPCIKEIPDFIELQKLYGEQGFQIIGIAIDDEDKVREFAKTFGINYPSLLAGADGIGLGKRFGNGIGALPYSIFVDREGEISNTIRGELSKKRAKEILETHGINL